MSNTQIRPIIPAGTNQPVRMRNRQAEIKQQYETSPQLAVVTDHARSLSTHIPAAQPLYGSVEFGETNPIVQDIALHRGVGGLSDKPVPGDILCGAIAGCLDSVIRVIANNLGIELTELEVRVEADVDLRGTLMIDPSVPIGFQKIRAHVHMASATDVPPTTFKAMIAAAERSCVVLQTLRNPPQIEIGQTAACVTVEAP